MFLSHLFIRLIFCCRTDVGTLQSRSVRLSRRILHSQRVFRVALYPILHCSSPPLAFGWVSDARTENLVVGSLESLLIVLEAETDCSVFWMIQNKFSITTLVSQNESHTGIFLDGVSRVQVLKSRWCTYGQGRLQARLGDLVYAVALSTRRVLILNWRLYRVFYGLMVCPWCAYSQTMISEASPSSNVCFFPLYSAWSVLRCCFLRRFLYFSLFSVVNIHSIVCVGHLLKSKCDILARLRHSSDYSSLKRLYLPQGSLTTCRSRSCLACEHPRPRLAPLGSNTMFFAGSFITLIIHGGREEESF